MSFYRTTNSTGASCSVNLPITGHVDSKKGDFVWQLNTTNEIYFKSHDFLTFQSILGPVWVRCIVTYSATWHMRPPKIPRWNFRSLRKVSSGTYLHKKTRKPEIPESPQVCCSLCEKIVLAFLVGRWYMSRSNLVSKNLIANCFRNFSKKNDSVITRKFCGHPLANIARVAWMTNFTKF